MFFWQSADGEYHEIDVFQATMIHREGEFAYLDMTLPADALLYNTVVAFQAGVLIFKGNQHGLAETVNDFNVRVRYVALPENYLEQREQLMPPKNDLFNVSALEAYPSLFFADRATHVLSLSPILPGDATVTLEDQILKNTFTVKTTKAPLSCLDLEVSAEWVQSLEGEFDAFPAIAQCFSSGMVNTLSPHSLKIAWPQEGRSLKQSGYTLIESTLDEISPPSTGSLNLYPTRTAPFLDGVVMRRLKRYWYKGRLLFYWIYRQKRREVFRCQLNRPYSTTGVSKKISLKLESLEGVIQPTHAQFFSSAQGRSAIEYALAIAKAHMIYQSRTVVAAFRVPIDVGAHLQPNQSIHMVHPLLNRVGKVISVRLFLSAEEGYAEVQMAFPFEETNWDQTVSLALPEMQEDLLSGEFIQGIEVLHDGRQQSMLLQQGAYPQIPPTEIILQLKSLKSKDTLEHIITTPPIIYGGNR